MTKGSFADVVSALDFVFSVNDDLHVIRNRNSKFRNQNPGYDTSVGVWEEGDTVI